MRKFTVLLFTVLFSVSSFAGMIYVPSNSTDNAKASVAPVAQTEAKKMSKGKLFMKVFKSKFEKLFAKGKKYGDKSKIAAALLCFFLGNLGVHDFYLGNKRNGFIKLGLTILGIVLMVVGFASVTATETVTLPALAIIGYIVLLGVGIWALIDFVRILTGSYEPVDGSYTD